jgi:hypothetical protein
MPKYHLLERSMPKYHLLERFVGDKLAHFGF